MNNERLQEFAVALMGALLFGGLMGLVLWLMFGG